MFGVMELKNEIGAHYCYYTGFLKTSDGAMMFSKPIIGALYLIKDHYKNK